MALEPTISSSYNKITNSLTFSNHSNTIGLQELSNSNSQDQSHKKYTSALAGRYVSDAMSKIWSDDTKFGLWRRMWYVLAHTQNEFGVAQVSQQQVDELEAALHLPIDYRYAAAKEKELRHDVMAHVHTLKEICPNASSIIHLGSTSCDITDNAELIQLKQAMELTFKNGLTVLNALREFAIKNRDVVIVGRTHGQAAQFTTVGKRACMWAESLHIALENLYQQIDSLKLRGVKGATGTQATLASLLDGDLEKVTKFEQRVCEKLGFKQTLNATGQTYHRIADHFALAPVVAIGATIAKICEDIRFLASHDEMGEPFESKQIGSSAMPYKQNPMRCERADGLARVLMTLSTNPAITAATQWLERSLDDSANRRIVMADTFMLVDAILVIAQNVVPGLRVHHAVINRHVAEQLPFMASEQIILDSVALGGNRQDIHEAIREHSTIVYKNVKELGLENDLLQRISNDERFPKAVRETLNLTDLNAQSYIGLAAVQVDNYCVELDQFLQKHGFLHNDAKHVDLRV